MLPSRQKRKREEDVLEEPNNSTNELPDERNPLLNDVVLGCLFKMCPLSDLRRFRLVSKQWYFHTLARCRKEMTVIIRPPTITPVRKFRVAEMERVFDWESLRRKLDVGDHPFRSYRLSSVNAFDLCDRNDFVNATDDNKSLRMLKTHLPLFFSSFGSSIHKLELCGSKDLLAILEETPNLEELILGGVHRKCRIAQREELRIQSNLRLKHLVLKTESLTLPFSWKFFFRRFPNIQKVDATLWFDYGPEESIQSLIEISQELNNKKNVKFFFSRMVLNPRRPAHILPAIRALELNLPQVTFHNIIIYGWSHDELLHQLIATALRHHGHTLKEFKLVVLGGRGVDWFADFPFHPGPFTSLTTLELRGQFCKNLRFLGEFPNVSTLKIRDCEGQTLRMSRGRLNFTLENIRVFHFSTKSTIPNYGMTIWANLMPNVEDFSGILSDSSLRTICEKWRKLKRLFIGSREFSLMKRRITDEAITGIVAGRDERLPNITDLHELESLSIPKPEKMSDTCIWNVFLKMPRLQHLSVQLSEETSEEASQALIKKFPGDAIIREGMCFDSPN